MYPIQNMMPDNDASANNMPKTFFRPSKLLLANTTIAKEARNSGRIQPSYLQSVASTRKMEHRPMLRKCSRFVYHFWKKYADPTKNSMNGASVIAVRPR